LIGPQITQATKLTLAALRAHVTRQLAWAEAAADPATKAEHERKAEGFQIRIAEIIARTTGTVAIAAEPTAEQPVAEPTAEQPVAEPTAEQPAREGWEPTPEPDPESEADNAAQDEADATRMSADPEPEPEPENKPATRRTKIKINRNTAA
jgi:hypothetical protein